MIVGKKPIGRPRTREKIVRKYITTIHENFQLENASDRDVWNEIVVAAIDLQGPISF